MGKFNGGQIVKCTDRTDDNPIFVMVLENRPISETNFNGVILFDKWNRGEPGEVFNWFTDSWELSNWDELKKWI